MEWIVVSFVVIVFWLVLEALALKRVAVKLARVTDLQVRSCAIVDELSGRVTKLENERAPFPRWESIRKAREEAAKHPPPLLGVGIQGRAAMAPPEWVAVHCPGCHGQFRLPAAANVTRDWRCERCVQAERDAAARAAGMYAPEPGYFTATALTVAAQERERKERLADEVAATIERAKRGGPPEVEDFDVKKGGVL